MSIGNDSLSLVALIIGITPPIPSKRKKKKPIVLKYESLLTGMKPHSYKGISSFSVLVMFMDKQNTEMVMRVTIIIANPNINPILNVSIFLTQARGENKDKTMKPICTSFRALEPVIDSIVDLRPSIMKASWAIVN